MLKNNLVFLREFITEFENTGTICPTSPLAAKALTAPLRERRGPISILELGPGTGSVTVQILKDMREEDTLTICEINPRFMRLLRDGLKGNPDFERHKDRILFFLGAAQDLPEDHRYDAVVCALPFLNFELETVQEIFAKLERVCTETTTMTYYEYIGLRSINKAVSKALGKQRIQEVDRFFKQISRKHNMRRKQIWFNMLPINVYRFELARTAHVAQTKSA